MCVRVVWLDDGAMDWLLIGVIGVIVLALVFDFTNGFHDAANSVATVVATRAPAGALGALVLRSVQLQRVLRRRHRGCQHGGEGGQT